MAPISASIHAETIKSFMGVDKNRCPADGAVLMM
jgi:hypothetical protein